MTTDITELAQREKFEAWAEERCALPWGYLKNRRTNTGYFSKHDYTSLWAAWKAAGAELVEALEKAQHVAAVDWEAAASLNVENQELKRRIAELESRTVTIKFAPIPVEELGNVRDGKKHPYMFGAGYNSAVIHCESVIQQELDAKGIKWEAE